jgi:tetratricopeptide (TPR) repeat protein
MGTDNSAIASSTLKQRKSLFPLPSMTSKRTVEMNKSNKRSRRQPVSVEQSHGIDAVETSDSTVLSDRSDIDYRDDVFRRARADASSERFDDMDSICWGGWIFEKLALTPLLRLSTQDSFITRLPDSYCGYQKNADEQQDLCLSYIEQPDLALSYYDSSDEDDYSPRPSAPPPPPATRKGLPLLPFIDEVGYEQSPPRQRANDLLEAFPGAIVKPPARAWTQSGTFINFLEDGVEVSVDTSGLDYDISEGAESAVQPCVNQDDTERIRQVLLDADALEHKGDLFHARSHLESFINTSRSSWGSDLQMADMYHRLGVLHWKLGSYGGSLRVLAKSFAMYEKAYGYSLWHNESFDCCLDHVLVITSVLNSFGRVHVSQAEYDMAMFYFQKSLRLLDKRADLAWSTGVLDDLQACRARTMLLVGTVYEASGGIGRALPLYKESRHLVKRFLGGNHVDYAACLNRIGAIYEEQAKLPKALKCYRRALAIYEKLAEDTICSPVDLATSQNNVGFVYYLSGLYDEALKFYTEALSILKDVVGINHRNTASTSFNMALAYQKLGNNPTALMILKDVLDCQRRLLGSNHSDVAITLDAIGKTYISMNQSISAVPCFEKALHIYRRAFGPYHVHVGLAFDRLGQAQLHCGNARKAERSFGQALHVYKGHIATDDISRRIRRVENYLAFIRTGNN